MRTPRPNDEHLGELPETLIFAAENDVLRDQGRLFADRLAAQGNLTTYTQFEGLIHNFMGYAGVSTKANEARGARPICTAG